MRLNDRGYLFQTTFLVVCGLLSIRIFILFLSQGINNYERARYLEMVNGTAYRPYVTRVFLPLTVRTLSSTIPSTWKENLQEQASQDPRILKIFEKLGWEMNGFVEYTLGVALMYVALLGSLAAMRWLCLGVYQPHAYLLEGIVLLELLALLPLSKAGHIYDYPALCLFTLGLGALVRKSWMLYLGFFALSCVNKETTLLLTLVFGLFFRNQERLSRPVFTHLLLAQSLLFVFIRGGLAFVYGGNPGSGVEFHLIDNLIRWREPVKGSSVGTFFGILLLMAFRWEDKPPFLRSAAWISVPLAILTLLFGVVGEWRVIYEFVPIGVLLAAHSMGEYLGNPLTQRA